MHSGRIVGVLILSLLCVSAPAQRSRASKPSSGYSNHLIGEKSPYLLLHAHNPVDWYPWDEEAFAKARRENKPIFLSIGYYTCHWCHVMERESYSNPAIAALLNRWFVSVKGGSGGAARRGPHLHHVLGGYDGKRRLAGQHLPYARPETVFRWDVFSAGGQGRACWSQERPSKCG